MQILQPGEPIAAQDQCRDQGGKGGGQVVVPSLLEIEDGKADGPGPGTGQHGGEGQFRKGGNEDQGSAGAGEGTEAGA